MLKGNPTAMAVFFCFSQVVSAFPWDCSRAEEYLSPTSRNSGPFVSAPVTPGLSPEVRRLPEKAPRTAGEPARTFPRKPGNYAMSLGQTAPVMPDPLLSESRAENPARTPSLDLGFEGMSFQSGGSGWPPDTIGDVGPNHYVQMVNTSFAIFDKNGNKLTGPTHINQLWQGEGNACEDCNSGDPVVLYDPLAGRWLLSQFAVCKTPYHECIAISQTSDPTGAYYLYAFEINDYFPDYPKFGVWPDAYYMSANESDVGAYAFDREKMLQGQAATYQKFERTGNFMLPSDLDGSTAPPTGSPNYFYTMKAGNVLEIWEFHADFTNPANSTFALAQSLTTSPFNYGVCGFSWDCIPQPGTSQRLDVISEWPMWRLQYRNFGTHETLVGNFTVNVGDFTDHAGIRWFELRKSGGGSWAIYQEGTHSPDAHHRWMGSVAMDGYGNMALGYSVSSTTLYPSIRYAARSASDALGTLQTEATLIAGSASQTSLIGTNRWGDYSSMNVDPSDDRTFWYTNEYLTNSAQQWQTRIGKFVIPIPVSTLYVSKDLTCGGKSPCYSSIQTAMDQAATGAVIKIGRGTFTESIALNTAKSLTFQGGWNSSFSAQSSNTTFIKAPTVTNGSLTLQMLTIPP